MAQQLLSLAFHFPIHNQEIVRNMTTILKDFIMATRSQWQKVRETIQTVTCCMDKYLADNYWYTNQRVISN